MNPLVLHVDVDEFVAAVEVLRQPELMGEPVIVGGRGDPTKRGVVSTASYEARRYGVHSGMALRVALRKCPRGVFLPVDKEAYEAASEAVMRILGSFTDSLEVWGWDEAFLDIHGDPEVVARAIRTTLSEETGLMCSVGIGDNKLRAKTASGLAKPAGIYRLTATEWFHVMGDRRTDQLWGVGKKTARRLAEGGMTTVRELAAANEQELGVSFGQRTGPRLIALARGEDSSSVDSVPRRAKSSSLELTFDEDVEDVAVIGAEVERMARALAERADATNRLVTGVAVKVRFAPFVTRTRSLRLDEPSADVERIEAGAAGALARFQLDRPVRLVGVRIALQ